MNIRQNNLLLMSFALEKLLKKLKNIGMLGLGQYILNIFRINYKCLSNYIDKSKKYDIYTKTNLDNEYQCKVNRYNKRKKNNILI